MWCQETENSLIQGNIALLPKIRQWPQKKERKKIKEEKRLCQLTSVTLCSLFWIS
jgi:ABC-type proline/glycine betaine transport systems, ATPase components